jgi:hypothetical protein
VIAPYIYRQDTLHQDIREAGSATDSSFSTPSAVPNAKPNTLQVAVEGVRPASANQKAPAGAAGARGGVVKSGVSFDAGAGAGQQGSESPIPKARSAVHTQSTGGSVRAASPATTGGKQRSGMGQQLGFT